MARSIVGLAVAALLALVPACAPQAPVKADAAPPVWTFPVEGGEWNQPEIFAAAEFDGGGDDDGLQIRLDGKDQTARFVPSWPAAFGPVSDEEEESAAPRSGQDAARQGGPAGRRRVLAILDPGVAGEGEHHLVLEIGGRTAERRFTIRRQGRRIRFQVLVVDGESERPGPARVTLVPHDGAPSVDLLPFPMLRDAGRRGGGRSVVLVREGSAEVWLPDGDYDAIAARGPLDGIETWTIPARGEAEHTFHLRREVDLPGTLAGDFHVHAAASRDSMVPPAERIWSALAGGLDFMVGSDHDIVADYEPILRRLPAARDRLRVVRGAEATQGGSDGSRGHWNFFPLAAETALPSPAETGDSDPDVAGATRRFLAAWRARLPEGEGVVQLNHPRGMHFQPRNQPVRRMHDWFNRVGFDPERPLVLPPEVLGFDLLEVWNRSSRAALREVRRDWFALLNAGIVRAAAANSDTHTVVPGLAGFPQNLVLSSMTDLMASVRAGRMIGTDGPVPLLTVRTPDAEAGPGGRLTVRSGRVRVEVEVRAAAWIPVGPIRVWSNGILLHESRPDRWPASVAFEARLEGDGWILAEAGDLDQGVDGEPLPGPYGKVVPRGLAFGFTNPVFVDADGDGSFRPDVLE